MFCTASSIRISRLIFQRNYGKNRAIFVENTRLVKKKEMKPLSSSLKIKSTSIDKTVKQQFDYLLVLDFEATCQESSKGAIEPIQEIIEFPVVQLCTKSWTEVRRFHEYVRPTENPNISTFCTSLTGIIQEMIDEKPILSEIISKFDKWIMEDKSLRPDNFAFVSCGDWDLMVVLPTEARYKNIKLPRYFDNWINIKKSYAMHTGQFARGMPQLLQIYNLQLIGRHHSGIDDVGNICEIVKCLARDGHNFSITSSPAKPRVFNNSSKYK